MNVYLSLGLLLVGAGPFKWYNKETLDCMMQTCEVGLFNCCLVWDSRNMWPTGHSQRFLVRLTLKTRMHLMIASLNFLLSPLRYTLYSAYVVATMQSIR